MKKIAVMVLLSLLFVSITQTLSFAIESESSRNTEPSNGKTVGEAAASATLAGAATGAAIGSVIPVVGTATGAVIGAIAGSVASWFMVR